MYWPSRKDKPDVLGPLTEEDQTSENSGLMVTAQLEVWSQIKEHMHMRRAEYQSLEPYPYPLSSLMNPTSFPGFVWGCSPDMGSMKWGTWAVLMGNLRQGWIRSSLRQTVVCNQERNFPCYTFTSQTLCFASFECFTMFIIANFTWLDIWPCSSICDHVHPK